MAKPTIFLVEPGLRGRLFPLHVVFFNQIVHLIIKNCFLRRKSKETNIKKFFKKKSKRAANLVEEIKQYTELQELRRIRSKYLHREQKKRRRKEAE
ncbi:hypothetical protein AtNW77_Chr4g0312961 [Arabidopsis thaliana]